MRAFLYRCPTTGFQVAGYLLDEMGQWHCMGTTCYVCLQIHLVNPATGEVLDEGERDDLTPVHALQLDGQFSGGEP
jgi:hypothetical protein